MLGHISIRHTVGEIISGASPVEFVLNYRGPLPSDGSPQDIHKIRKSFHPQLKTLWETHPLLVESTKVLLLGQHQDQWVRATKVQWISRENQRGPYYFTPLVSNSLNLICSLDIQFLRRESPGHLISQGGDIDNRLKTLFDAMRIPDNNQISPKMIPAEGEDPFFCLLEDDALIIGVCVKTERLLTPLETTNNHERGFVALNIFVKIATTLASETEAFNRLKPT